MTLERRSIMRSASKAVTRKPVVSFLQQKSVKRLISNCLLSRKAKHPANEARFFPFDPSTAFRASFFRPGLKAFFAQKTNPPVDRRIGFFNCHSVEQPAHRLANGRSIPAEADCLMSERLVAPTGRKRANGCAFDVRDIVDYN
jgi:hypothetical protein